ncbi:MAG: sigma 54-interacting transcriptional regulator [Bacteroidales bacterium]|nr:sigma 54-interacting transcriptional regulator [Bacteroidales bacterium]
MIEKDKDIIIKRSHSRSKSFGIDPQCQYPKLIIKGKELEYQLKENKELIDIAEPIMTQLLSTVEKNGFMIVLTDSDACILKIIGGKETLKAAQNLNMIEGASMSEKSIGTNAMGTAISENAAVQITAKEHFISAYHQWTCSAAPIHYNNKVIGTLNLTGKAENVHPHTLGLVMAAVSAIENKLTSNLILKELFASRQYAWAMMNNLAYGVFAIDLNDEIKWVNDSACRIINIRRKSLLDKEIKEFLPDWYKIKRIVLNDLSFLDQESTFQIPEIRERFLFNAYLIKNEQQEILGYLVTFRPMSRMLNLIKKYSGLHAHYTFDEIISKSPQTVKLIEYAKRVANSPSTVLITGESGTGKEVFAQAIHNASERHNSAFVAVNCGAISPTLIESEMFGYEEGAFTGARKGGCPGKFELANGGTIFLDEIGEMPVDMQIKLLRVLQEGTVTRVGAQESKKIDIRVIAATNKNLEDEVEKGDFRLDLFYRLNVIPIHIPSLRNRREDIIPLARHFMVIKSEKLNKPIPELSDDIKDKLLNYSWHGNVRELENYIEKIVNLGDNKDYCDINIDKNSAPIIFSKPIQVDKLKTLEEIERETIVFTIQQLNGNISKVAKSLGIGRNTLYAKLKKFNINL